MKNYGIENLFRINFQSIYTRAAKRQNGFTLIELIIVVAILAALAGLMLPGFNFFQQQRALDAGVQEIINTLRLAQNRTLASEGATNYGVHFASDRFTLFTGSTFNPSAATNQEHILHQNLSIVQINLAPSSAVAFERLTGHALDYGSVKIEIINNADKNKTIYISSNGIISLASDTASDDSRIKDSRHVHALYSQNTKNAITLSLDFPADGVLENIAFQNYLNADKTEFSWEGTINVNGSAQQLKIHSHSLTETAILFCFHRDRRFNSKALNIFLDGQNLINYSATGATTPGSSLWVDQPEIQ